MSTLSLTGRLLLLLLLLPALAHAQGPTRSFVSPNAEASGDFGYSVAHVPDVNGDGRSEVLVGARLENGGPTNAGRVHLFSGATGALLRTLQSPNPETDGFFGAEVSGAEDADGDGRGELIVGAPGQNSGAGRAYLFSGATGALLRVFTSPNATAGGYFGDAVTSMPDMNGDGRPDVLIGAFGESVGTVSAGRAYLFSGINGVLLRTFTSPNPEEHGRFGSSVSRVPDANGDGRADLLVGAWSEAGGADSAGRAYLFSGATGALLRTLQSPNPEALGQFGVSVAGVPDANGDRRGDLLIGANSEIGAGAYSGRAYLFSGATGAVLRTLNSPAGGRFGTSVAGVADANGDGRGDLLIGAPLEGATDVGRVYLFSGANGALLRTLQSPNPATSGWFGYTVSGFPDNDGDGRSELLVGAPKEHIGAIQRAGRAYLFTSRPLLAAGTGEQRAALPTAVLASPNPFAGRTTLRFALTEAVPVRLSVHDVLGREVAVLVDGAVEVGTHTSVFEARGLASGVYVWRLVAGGAVQTGRITLLE